MYVILASDPLMESHVKKEAQHYKERFRKNKEKWSPSVIDSQDLSPNDITTITFRGHGFAPDDDKDPTFGGNQELAHGGFTPQTFYEMLKQKKAIKNLKQVG